MEENEELINFGGAVKALPDNRVGGYLVTSGGLDMTGDFFASDTDFGVSDKLPVLYHHGFDTKIGKRKIGQATIRRDEVGLWAEAQLEMRDEYEKAIYTMAAEGKLGWASGAAAHTVERKMLGSGNKIKQWYMAEASLTPTPAEPRNGVMSIKSLYPSAAAAVAEPDDTKTLFTKSEQEYTMDENEIKAMVEKATVHIKWWVADILEITKHVYGLFHLPQHGIITEAE